MLVRELSDKYISNRCRAGSLTDTLYQLHTLVLTAPHQVPEQLREQTNSSKEKLTTYWRSPLLLSRIPQKRRTSATDGTEPIKNSGRADIPMTRSRNGKQGCLPVCSRCIPTELMHDGIIERPRVNVHDATRRWHGKKQNVRAICPVRRTGRSVRENSDLAGAARYAVIHAYGGRR